jgi:hypothetical protein
MMSNQRQQIENLRARAAICRGLAAIKTNGGHSTDRLLLAIADDLDREADELSTSEDDE